VSGSLTLTGGRGLPSASSQSVAFRTLGCKLNQCETAQMEEALRVRGYTVVPWEEPAAYRIVNTCTVTAKTDRTCRHEIRRAMRRDPGCRVVVTGCYAHVAPEKVAAIPGVALVLGNPDKSRLADYLADLPAGGSSSAEAAERGDPPCVAVTPYADSPAFEGDFFTHFSGYTRAFLKVQNGCDASCSYCVIPAARGPSRSMPAGEVLAQMRLLADQGYREVVLTGIHVGSWGRDIGEGGLADLLAVLATDGAVARYRLSSTEPMEVDDDVLAVMRTHAERFAPHFHVPLQSGSSEILRRMNRPYTAEQYALRVRSMRQTFPDAAIGTDVIVGFPGETEAHFRETYELVEDLPLTYLHVFAYSDRPGTRASKMASKVSPEVIEDRSFRLRALGAQKRGAFEERFRGNELHALLLRQRSPDGRLTALTGNYIEVLVEADERLINRFVYVRPDTVRPEGGWMGSLLRVAANPAPVSAVSAMGSGNR
jgi:threonylcarbamoyladenosine tRNA methylthiotransferase MtaB